MDTIQALDQLEAEIKEHQAKLTVAYRFIKQLKAENKELRKADSDHLSAKKGLDQRFIKLQAENEEQRNLLDDKFTPMQRMALTEDISQIVAKLNE